MEFKNKEIKLTLYLIITIILTLGLSISFQSVLAVWTGPTATPPSSNIAEPINQTAACADPHRSRRGTSSSIRLSSIWSWGDNPN